MYDSRYTLHDTRCTLHVTPLRSSSFEGQDKNDGEVILGSEATPGSIEADSGVGQKASPE